MTKEEALKEIHEALETDGHHEHLIEIYESALFVALEYLEKEED